MQIWDDFHVLVFWVGEVVVDVFVALSAQVGGLTVFQLVTDTGHNRETYVTAFAFSLFHLWLKHHKGILFLDVRVNAAFVVEPDVLENNHMVTASLVSVKVRPSENYSQVFYFGLVHRKLVEICLVTHFDVFYQGVNLLLGVMCSFVVNILLDQEKWSLFTLIARFFLKLWRSLLTWQKSLNLAVNLLL